MVVRLSPSFREGSDVREQEAPNTTAISIHAPAKGATVAGSPQTLISSFQSTLPRRERPQLIREVNVPNTFQSTLPRRERLHVLPVPLFNAEFQSTLPRRERHQAGRTSDEAFRISIHAPAKGATISASIHCWSTAQFQSTLPRRERRLHAGFHGRRKVI